MKIEIRVYDEVLQEDNTIHASLQSTNEIHCEKIDCKTLDEIGKILKGQPVFTILAQDNVGIGIIEAYRRECIDLSTSTVPKNVFENRKNFKNVAKRAMSAIKEFRTWRKANKALCKYPD